MKLPKPNEFGSYVLPDGIIYPSGASFDRFDKDGKTVIAHVEMKTSGQYMLWKSNGGFVMDSKGPRYFDTPLKALDFYAESK